MSEYTAEQKQAIASIESNTAVVAGAGSGKTSVLVARYIRLLQAGFACRSILAITFTNKAAGEMAQRIREEITALALQAQGEQKRFWLEQKALLASAYIGTIHGLCVDILRSHPVQAGIAPDFSVLDETEAILLTEQAVKDTLYGLIGKQDQAVEQLCQQYGYGRLFAALQNLLPQFTVDEVRQAGFAGKLAQGHLEALQEFAQEKSAFKTSLAQLLAGIETHKATAHRSQLELLRENIQEINKAVEALNTDSCKIFLLDGFIDPLAARSSDKLLVNQVKAHKQKLAELCHDSKALLLLPHWAKLICACVESFWAAKKARGVLTFDDLEHLTCKLLLENPDLCQKYADKYEQIMLDEFQDTNELQKILAYLLAGNDACRLQGSKLFVVGDDKQSIYRFRGADVSIFDKVKEEILAAGGAQIQLMKNFRSHKEILSVCNDLFSQVMAGSSIAYLPLQAGKKQSENDCPAVESIILPAEGAPLGQAQAIAARLKELAGQEGRKYSGMAVLLRAKTHLDAYIKAFEQEGIPYNILDGQGYFEVPEVADLLNLLRFLDNPLRDLPLLGVLRSPLFALDDQTLTQIFLQPSEDSLWLKLNAHLNLEISDEQWAFVLRARELLAGLLQNVQVHSLGVLLRLIIDRLKVMPLMMSYPDAAQRYANIEKLVDIVFAFEYEKNGDLSAFLQHIDNLLAKEAREELEQIETEASEAVKVLTIHKSKGLQFKVVVIAECEAAFYREKEDVFYDKSKGLGLKVRGAGGKLEQTGCFRRLREHDAAANNEEMKRLLYVAMTRAEEKLIIAGQRSKIEEKASWLNWFLQAFTEDEEYFRGPTGAIKKVTFVGEDAFSKRAPSLAAQASELDCSRLLQQIRQLPVEMQREFYFSATSLSDYRHCQKMFYYKYVLEMPGWERKPVLGEAAMGEPPARLTGLIVHEVLQNIATGNLAEVLDKACQRYLPVQQTRQAQAAILPWLQLYVDGSIYAHIRDKQHFSEYPFSLPLLSSGEQSYIFTGVIDCLVFEADGSLSIIDFKSDKSAEGKLADYGLQLYLYTLAAKKLFAGQSIASVQLHFVRLNEQLSFDSGMDMAGQITLLCQEISGKKEEADFSYNHSWCGFCDYTYFCPYYKE